VFLADPAGADASTGLRNLLYAFQWWVFGAFAIFMWWRWLMEDVLERPRAGATGGGG
jgi:surfeit locus 1 family protein